MKANFLLAVSIALTASTAAAIPLGIPLGNGKFYFPVRPLDKRRVTSIEEFHGKFPLGPGLANLPIANEKREDSFDEFKSRNFHFPLGLGVTNHVYHEDEKREASVIEEFASRNYRFPLGLGRTNRVYHEDEKREVVSIDEFHGKKVPLGNNHNTLPVSIVKRDPVVVGQFDDPKKQPFLGHAEKRDAARIGEFDDILRKQFVKIDDGTAGVKREAEAEPFVLLPGMTTPEACKTAGLSGLHIACL